MNTMNHELYRALRKSAKAERRRQSAFAVAVVFGLPLAAIAGFIWYCVGLVQGWWS